MGGLSAYLDVQRIVAPQFGLVKFSAGDTGLGMLGVGVSEGARVAAVSVGTGVVAMGVGVTAQAFKRIIIQAARKAMVVEYLFMFPRFSVGLKTLGNLWIQIFRICY